MRTCGDSNEVCGGSGDTDRFRFDRTGSPNSCFCPRCDSVRMSPGRSADCRSFHSERDHALPVTRTAVYTGSFDPLSLGHLNVIERSSRLFDQLVIGIGINVEKRALFSPAERFELVRECVRDLPNVEVRTFSGLAVEFVRNCGSRIMIRGIRPLTDVSGEITMLLANRELDPEVETVFLMADQLYAHVSSTLIKQIAPLASDDMLGKFVPDRIIQPLRKRLAELEGVV